jgi:hypothetical protein
VITLRRVSAKKFVIGGLIVLALTCVALLTCLDAYYHENHPAEPQSTEGRLYATKLSKGVWVYLTSREQLVYKLIMPSSAILLIISILLNHWWKQFPIQKVFTRLRE